MNPATPVIRYVDMGFYDTRGSLIPEVAEVTRTRGERLDRGLSPGLVGLGTVGRSSLGDGAGISCSDGLPQSGSGGAGQRVGSLARAHPGLLPS